MRRPSAGRVWGAACTGIDHAGESPAAAIARFGCVAVPDGWEGQPSGPKARVEALGAERSESSGGRAKSGAAAQSEHCRVEMASHERRVGLTVVRPEAQADSGEAEGGRETGGSGRGSDDAGDSIALAEQRTRGTAPCAGWARTRPDMPMWANGKPRSSSRRRTKGASNSPSRKGAPRWNVWSRCLEAVLGKNPPYGISEGPDETELRGMLNGHEAGNGGYGQACTYRPPRLGSTRQIHEHALRGGFRNPGPQGHRA
jgi:hypothetical protein